MFRLFGKDVIEVNVPAVRFVSFECFSPLVPLFRISCGCDASKMIDPSNAGRG